MKVWKEVDSDEIHEAKQTDDRGRLTLGTEYANEELDIVVVNREKLPEEAE